MPCSYVLLVDDNPLSLKIAFQLFDRLGWCVIRCQLQDQALQALLDNPSIQLVLCDFMLGTETALRFVKEVRAYEKESMSETRMPIVGFSSHPRAKTDFLAAGGDDFYEKPLTKANVMDMISRYTT